MKKYLYITFVLFSNILYAQDTIKVKRAGRGDEYCWVNVYTNGIYYADSIPKAVLMDESKLELRINENCPVKEKADVFVASFELETESNGASHSSKAESSFCTGRQKNEIMTIPPGGSFNIKNIVVHAPDGFRKIENFKIFVK